MPNSNAWNSNKPVAIPKDGTPVWLPLVPLGEQVLQVSDPDNPGRFKTVTVQLKREWLDEMVANFNDGFPTALGVPVHERADHSINPDGAYAYYTDMEFREDGDAGPGVYGLYSPTEYGKVIIASGALPYTSPRFTVGDLPDKDWGRRNVVICAAQTPLPQLGGQPHMILASAQFEEATAASAATDTPTEGEMAPMPDDIQAQIDAAIAAAKATWEQDQADALAALETEKADLLTQIDTLTAQVGDHETLKKQVEMLMAEREQSSAQKRLDDAVREFEAVRIPVETVLPDGTKQTDIKAYTPEAVQIAASFKVDHADPAKAGAYWSLVLANNNALPMVTVTADKPALQIAASAGAPAAGPAMTEDQKLQDALAKGAIDQPMFDSMYQMMQTDHLSFHAAYQKLANRAAGL